MVDIWKYLPDGFQQASETYYEHLDAFLHAYHTEENYEDA